ncbi:hypothetical protein ABI_02760 [Asticcacaulis biprosthecium C19]|uniref:Uncharacterized protein n=1 Tax=Asticcacaulis biprosthecium C19 TaxID=715226 RepID=F4QIT5_9CAUL|nr:hypothetical protein ABI_02760 [Asticcacaulis biprosthecium C19]
MIRYAGYSFAELKSRLALIQTNPGYEYYVKDIWTYIEDADRERRKTA